jgi:hercynine metabolism protein
MSSSWLEELEDRLEQRLEAFLQANPQQEALLAEQESRERQERLLRERQRLRQEAELQRQALLELAGEIRQWQERVERARAAGATDLAGRAEAHIGALMERGRDRWASLGELGGRFAEVQNQLDELSRSRRASQEQQKGGRRATEAGEAKGPGPSGTADNLEADWAAFEAQQDLQDLRRRMQL